MGETIYYRIAEGSAGPHFHRKKDKADSKKAIDYDRPKRRWVLRFVQAAAIQDNHRAWNTDFLALAQNGLCGICGHPLIWVASRNGHMRTTIEHVIPQRRGGQTYGNIVKAHRRCNEDKGDRWPTGCEILFLAATNVHLIARAKR